MGQQLMPQQVACCKNGRDLTKQCEVQIWELSDHPNAPHSFRQLRDGCSADPIDFNNPEDWGCSSCRAEGDESQDAIGLHAMDTLSYVPVRFDVSNTVDHERSQARYSKIVVHSSRARTQRRSKAWEEWLRAATAGRKVTVLVGAGFNSTQPGAAQNALPGDCEKVSAKYRLDRGLTKISIVPSASCPEDEEDNTSALTPVTILVDNIQVVCALTEFMLLSEVMEAQLDDSERSRAVLVQYLSEGNESKRVCFLEESENAKDRCIQALTALWLEKSQNHSMWF